jgi:SpoVK/Ycf46/Vps4 family AAA+-type ATPase
MGLNNLPPWHNKNNKKIKYEKNNNINKSDPNKKDNKFDMILELLNEFDKLENNTNNKNTSNKNNNIIKEVHIAQITPDMLFNPFFGLPNLQMPKLSKINNNTYKKDNQNKKDNKDNKDNFEININNKYDELDIKINNIQDLINLGKMYSENHNYAINLKRLNDLIPTLERLENVVGMNNVKKNIVNQIVYFMSGLDINDDMLHTVITGPPGVGKTLLGNIIGEIYFKLGIVKGNGVKHINPITKEEKDYIFKIAKRSDLIGEFLGHTAIKTQKVIDECEGGVLFIDEAYSLGNEEKKDIYSKECIDTINQNLTEKKTQFICIIAGYPEALEKCFFSINDGLKRRFPFKYNIDKYTPEELTQILMLMIKNKKWKLDNNLTLNEIIEFMKNNYDKFPNYGGDIETLFFNIRVSHSLRTIGKLPSIKKYITIQDIQEGFNIYSKNIKIEDNSYLHLYM